MRNIFICICVLTVTFGMISCDPKELEIPDADSYSRVYLRDALENPVAYLFPMRDQWDTISLGVGHGGLSALNKEVTVTLKPDISLVAEFNIQNGTNYPAMPGESYRLTSNTVVLPSGKSASNSLKLAVNPLLLTGPQAHLLPISIESVSDDIMINENLKTIYYLITGVYEENPFEKFSMENWTIHGYSSDENDGVTTGGRAHHAIDENMVTIWHSQWRKDANGNRPGHPHFISTDMNESKRIHGLEIFGRDNQIGGTGNPRDIVVELSGDGENWTATSSYTLENVASNTIYFPTAAQARYFKITINASHGNVYKTHIAEINAF